MAANWGGLVPGTVALWRGLRIVFHLIRMWQSNQSFSWALRPTWDLLGYHQQHCNRQIVMCGNEGHHQAEGWYPAKGYIGHHSHCLQRTFATSGKREHLLLVVLVMRGAFLCRLMVQSWWRSTMNWKCVWRKDKAKVGRRRGEQALEARQLGISAAKGVTIQITGGRMGKNCKLREQQIQLQTAANDCFLQITQHVNIENEMKKMAFERT